MNLMQIDFLQPIYTLMFSNGLIACLVFIGIGAITDLDFLIAKPLPSLLLATAAEFGTIFTFPIAMAFGFTPGKLRLSLWSVVQTAPWSCLPPYSWPHCYLCPLP